MESHPLNLAHQQHRRAEAHMSNYRYDEAMQCHHNAAELLLDAMKSTTSTIALESITLQHSYHLKQKDLIKSKKGQYARVKTAIDNLKLVGKDPLLNVKINENSKLQVAIYKAINETDSLLHILLNKNEDLAENKTQVDTIPSNDFIDGKKKEKTQQTVIEELQTLSQNLHSLVEQLVVQVEVLKDENMTLKERVNYLEKERVRYLSIPSNYDETSKMFSPLGASTEIATDVLALPNMAVSSQITNRSYVPSVEQTDLLRAAEKPKPKQQPHFDLSAFKND